MDAFLELIDRVMISCLLYSSPKIIKLLNSNYQNKGMEVIPGYSLPSSYMIIPIKDYINNSLYEYFEDKYKYLILNREGLEVFCITESLKSLIDYFQTPRSATELKKFFSDSQQLKLVEKLLHSEIIKPNLSYDSPNIEWREDCLLDLPSKYRIKKNLTSNHNSSTYILTCNYSNVEYVLKCFNNTCDGIEHEIAVRERVESSFLPKLIEVDTQRNFIVLEFVNGLDLRSYLSTYRPVESIEKIARNIIAAISILHSNSFMHGDLHLGQFIVENDSNVKLIDWELLVDLSLDSKMETQQGGVFEYLSPEIIQQDCFNPIKLHKSSTVTEVYRLGVILYYLFYREFPYVGITWSQLYTSIKNDPLDLPHYNIYGQLVPDKIKKIIKLCLEKDPLNRPQSAKEVSEILKS